MNVSSDNGNVGVVCVCVCVFGDEDLTTQSVTQLVSL